MVQAHSSPGPHQLSACHPQIRQRKQRHQLGRVLGQPLVAHLGEAELALDDTKRVLYQAVDRDGDTVDFLLTAKRDLAAARRFLERAINLHDVPEKITIDKSGANTAAIESVKADACVDILMRQNKCLNNIVAQDHRAIKRVTRPMLGFKSFWSAQKLIAGIETIHMIRKGQLDWPSGQPESAANQFYSLAA